MLDGQSPTNGNLAGHQTKTDEKPIKKFGKEYFVKQKHHQVFVDKSKL